MKQNLLEQTVTSFVVKSIEHIPLPYQAFLLLIDRAI